MTLDHRTGWDEALETAARRIRQECRDKWHNLTYSGPHCNCEDFAYAVEATLYMAPKVPTPTPAPADEDTTKEPATLRDAVTAYAADWAARGTENPGTEIYAEFVAKDLGDLLTKHADAATVARSKVAEAATATADAIANGGDYYADVIDSKARDIAAEAFRHFASLFEETA